MTDPRDPIPEPTTPTPTNPLVVITGQQRTDHDDFGDAE